MPSAPLRVFVVDDSAVVRQAFTHMLADVPDIELSGCAPNPLLAAPMLRRHRPDVLLLDIEMPGMDGLTFLRRLMAEAPIPTVICSSLTTAGSRTALDALAAGAVAVVSKPKFGLRDHFERSRGELLAALRTAAHARPRLQTAPIRIAHAKPATQPPPGRAANRPVLIGGSTGGTQALESLLMRLPADCPPIAAVLHMPERFTRMYAERLNGLCAMQVREARDGDRMERGLVLIAPGAHHLQLRRTGVNLTAEVGVGPPVNRHVPSVDVLFRSAAGCIGADALAILLTGMGDDGARGIKLLHEHGVRTIAQDEASCVVFGMPKEAIRLGGVDVVLPLDRIADEVFGFDAS